MANSGPRPEYRPPSYATAGGSRPTIGASGDGPARTGTPPASVTIDHPPIVHVLEPACAESDIAPIARSRIAARDRVIARRPRNIAAIGPEGYGTRPG
ncbi:hypothetical protein Maq22A_c24250 [Methylobacterium aquaticum]|uniref:Uncharacterized protein n=1 Tax=Methylobacterium aquaticum TaxID=270351 RepID=A0A0C6FX16_9HYPH|nr:hypothetical protein Maq22A_c24250 [Methylobacterium aquaticum]